jgi:hypothetical protein
MEPVKYEKLPCRICGKTVLSFSGEKKPICFDCRVEAYRKELNLEIPK